MRYSEMIGLPGAGKTTALLSSDRGDFHRFPTGNFIDRRVVTVRASAHVSRKLRKPSARLRSMSSDSWGASVVAPYAQLFSRVFQLVDFIPDASRQREIIVNYWRERLARHLVVSAMSSKKLGLTDEGLVQTLISTTIRAKGLEPSDARAIGLVSQVVEALPHIDVVFNFQVGRTNIERRLPKTQVHWALTQRTEEWLSRVVLLSAEAGLNIQNVDASLSPREIQHQLKNSVS